METGEAESSVVSKQGCQAQDMICGKSAFLFWCVPAFALFIGFGWNEVRPWLWIPAFLVMGVACVVNAARCGRLHCYVTGPIFLLAAVYVALSAFGLLPMKPGIFLCIVLGITALAYVAELPLGTYRNRT